MTWHSHNSYDGGHFEFVFTLKVLFILCIYTETKNFVVHELYFYYNCTRDRQVAVQVSCAVM